LGKDDNLAGALSKPLKHTHIISTRTR
jgi:hypothetical protein